MAACQLGRKAALPGQATELQLWARTARQLAAKTLALDAGGAGNSLKNKQMSHSRWPGNSHSRWGVGRQKGEPMVDEMEGPHIRFLKLPFPASGILRLQQAE